MSKKPWTKGEGLLFSKGIVIVSFLFLGWVIWSILNLPAEGTGYNNATVYAAMVTAAGALCVTAVVWYLKKTHVGYTSKVQTALYKKLVYYDWQYTKATMELKAKLKLTDGEVASIVNQSKARTIANGGFSAVNDGMRSAMAEGTASIKKETGN